MPQGSKSPFVIIVSSLGSWRPFGETLREHNGGEGSKNLLGVSGNPFGERASVAGRLMEFILELACRSLLLRLLKRIARPLGIRFALFGNSSRFAPRALVVFGGLVRDGFAE